MACDATVVTTRAAAFRVAEEGVINFLVYCCPGGGLIEKNGCAGCGLGGLKVCCNLGAVGFIIGIYVGKFVLFHEIANNFLVSEEGVVQVRVVE